jgi:integrase
MNLVSALESNSAKKKRTALEILDYMEKKQQDLLGKVRNVDDGNSLIADAFKNDLDLLRNSLKERH